MASGEIDWESLRRAVNSQTSDYFSRLPPAPPTTASRGSFQSTYSSSSAPSSSSSLLALQAPPSSSASLFSSSIPSSSVNESLLASINEAQLSIKNELQHLVSSHSESFSSLIHTDKEHSRSMQDLSSQLNGLSRQVAVLDGQCASLQHQQRQSLDNLEYCTAGVSKHGLWLSHADGRLTDLDSKVQLLHHQSMQLSLQTQSTVSRGEVDAQLAAFLNVSKVQWKTHADAADDRLLSAEQMQARVAKELSARCQTLEQCLGIVSEYDDSATGYEEWGRGRGQKGRPDLSKSAFVAALQAKIDAAVKERVAEAVKSIKEETLQLLQNGGGFGRHRQDEEEMTTKMELLAMKEELAAAIRAAKKASDEAYSRLSSSVEGHTKSLSSLSAVPERLNALETKLSDALADVASLKAEAAALQFDLKSLCEEVEGDRARNKAQGKTIGGGMVELKKTVEQVEASLAERDRQSERESKRAAAELQALRDKVLTSEGGADFARKFQQEFDKAAERLTEENKVEKNAVTKILSEIAKINLEMNKLETGLLKEENERKDAIEEASLELGVLKIKVDEVSGSFGSVGGRILIVEEQVKAVVAAQKQQVDSQLVTIVAKGGQDLRQGSAPPPTQHAKQGSGSMSVTSSYSVSASTVVTASGSSGPFPPGQQMDARSQSAVFSVASSGGTNDSFEADEAHDAVNTEREKAATAGRKPPAGLAQLNQLKGGGSGRTAMIADGAPPPKGPPVKVAAVAVASPASDESEDEEKDEEEEAEEEDLDESFLGEEDDDVDADDDEDDDDDDSLEIESDKHPKRGRVGEDDCDAIEEVETPVAVPAAPAVKKASPKKVSSVASLSGSDKGSAGKFGGVIAPLSHAGASGSSGSLPAALEQGRPRLGSVPLIVPPPSQNALPPAVPKAGDRVKARWRGGRSWFKGVCVSVSSGGAPGAPAGLSGQVTFHVQYDDQSVEKFVRREHIVVDEDAVTTTTTSSTVGGGAAGAREAQAQSADEGDGRDAQNAKPPGPPVPSSLSTASSSSDAENAEKQLQDSTSQRFPSHIFVRRWRPEHVRSWLQQHVRLPSVASAFYAKRMDGEMLLDKNWTSADMELDLSHPTKGMGIANAQHRARVSAFVKALRERDAEARNMRIRNYYLIWGEEDEDKDRDENEEDA